jgi:hypothetical protein
MIYSVECRVSDLTTAIVYLDVRGARPGFTIARGLAFIARGRLSLPAPGFVTARDRLSSAGPGFAAVRAGHCHRPRSAFIART